MWWFIGIVVVILLVGLAVRSRRRRSIGETPGYQGTEQQKTIGRYGEHL